MRKIDPNGEQSDVVSGRVVGPDLEWIDETWKRLGYKNRSQFVRELVRVGRQHEKELQAAS